MNNNELERLDSEVPGGAYLCQVKSDISCGACCGLYNTQDSSRDYIEGILLKRTELFKTVKRTPQDIQAFADKVSELENQERPFEEFHHCPYIGLMGDKLTCVGCLLHPLADGNNGVDLRGMSFYGGMACRSYFCPTCKNLPSDWKKIIREASSDWYLHGLIVTEEEMLDCFFKLIEEKSGQKLDSESFINNPVAISAVKSFIQFKENWPYRVANFKFYGNYFFEDNMYGLPEIEYPENRTSVLDPVFKALRSEFKSCGDLEKAEELIMELINEAVSGISNT